MFKKSIFLMIFLFVAFALLFIPLNTLAAKNDTEQSAQEKLSVIEKYQEQYFEIVKRNNYFLNTEYDFKKDKKDLNKLYKNVRKQITNKGYLKEYKSIEKRHSKCDAITTVEMNECAYNNYKDVDDLLNKVYKEAKSKISSKDFEKLAQDEKKWLKEVEDYNEVFDSMGFGTIGTVIYYGYQIDMRQFRTLLLMMLL